MRALRSHRQVREAILSSGGRLKLPSHDLSSELGGARRRSLRKKWAFGMHLRALLLRRQVKRLCAEAHHPRPEVRPSSERKRSPPSYLQLTSSEAEAPADLGCFATASASQRKRRQGQAGQAGQAGLGRSCKPPARNASGTRPEYAETCHGSFLPRASQNAGPHHPTDWT